MGKNWKNNDGGGRGRTHYQKRCNNRQDNFKQANKKFGRFGGGEKMFPKFVDNERSNNQSTYWQYNDGNINNSFQNNGHTDAGIVPWFRENPINPLVIPSQHLNIENDFKIENKEVQMNNNKEIVKDNVEMTENPPTVEKSDKENSVYITRKDSMSTTSTFPQASAPPKIPVETNFSVKVGQKTDIGINLKQERKSSSSSSSSSKSSSSESSSESSSPVVAKKKITSTSKAPSSPLNIKLKPKITPVNSTPVKSSQKCKAPTDSSSSPSSSSSSSDEEKKQGTPILSKKEKNSEDDVVCIGNLDNKIVLEDESDKDVENEEPTKKVVIKNKTSAKKSTEKCMICDTKGHTSFECQMICKNCATPYHSYRTCPQPANLNTMLQMFMEFCMQQFQHFCTENAIHPSHNVPKPQVDSPNSIGASNKSKNLKRKLSKTYKSNTKTKSSKKRKVHNSNKTKKYKNSRNNSSDEDDSDETNSDSETSIKESEDESSDSPVESVVSSKKKLKTKNMTTCSKTTSNSTNLSANPTNLPIVLNGFPNLTVPTVSVHTPNTSTNALNTLLLTQMFQNVIGSLKQ